MVSCAQDVCSDRPSREGPDAYARRRRDHARRVPRSLVPLTVDSLGPLLAATGRGDVEAFDAVYSAAHTRVLGLAVRILGDQHLAEEVTQEVFLEIWLRPDRFDPRRGSGLSLLMSITHHKSVDRVRRSESIRRRDATHVDSSHHTPYDETVTSVTASLDAQWVQGALDVLSWQQREAIELAYFGGYTHTEVSSILDVPLGTTKSRIRDGLLRLRVQMVPAAA